MQMTPERAHSIDAGARRSIVPPGSARAARGPLLTLAAVIALAWLAAAFGPVPEAGVVLVLAVLYSTSASGIGPAVASVVIAAAYYALPFAHPDRSAGQIVVATVGAVVVGVGLIILVRRFRAALFERWRGARKEAFKTMERLESILEIDPDGLMMVDADGHVTFANAAATELLAGLGTPDGDGAGRLPLDTITRHDGEPFGNDENPFLRPIRTGRPVRGVEAAYETQGGVSRSLSVNATPLEHARGGKVEAVVSLRDITDQKKTEDGLRFLAEASRILATTLDYTTTLRSVVRLAVPALADWCTVDLLDEDGSVRRVQIAHADKERETLLPDELRREAPPLDSGSPVARVLRTGEAMLVPEVDDDWLRRAARSESHLRLLRRLGIRSAMLVPLKARERTVGVLTCSMADSGRLYGPADLSLAKELAGHASFAVDNASLYLEAQQASRAKSDFLAVMSHELRTPLSAIMGYADLLGSGVAGSLESKQKEHLRRIRMSALHLLQLIEEILAYARMEAGREVVRNESIDLVELTRDIASLIDPIAADKDVRFVVEVPTRPMVRNTDPAKVRQVLLNLLSNAVKFTDEGEVRLEMASGSDEVVYRVLDTGMGIEPQDVRTIFDPFWQVNQSASRRAGGAGLGLSVVHRLARMLGGDVSVDSEPGRGSTFTVRIPVPEGR